MAGMAAGGQTAAVDAEAELVGLINGFQASQAIYVAARLGLPDLMGSIAKSAVELAAETRAHPTTLDRLLRALASIGLFVEHQAGRFALSSMGERLRSGIAGSCAPLALLVGQPKYWQAWGDLLTAVRIGAAEPMSWSDDDARTFDEGMAGDTDRLVQAVLATVDFTRCRHVVDVGCGTSLLLPKILAERSFLSGTMFDRPHTIDRFAATSVIAGLSGRCRTIGGNFFVSVPTAADAYLLNAVLHEWSDAAATDILRTCRKGMTRAARVVIIEHVVGSPNSGAAGAFTDLAMLVTGGGRERTRDEFGAIIANAGLRLASIMPTATPMSIIEAVLEAEER